MALNNLAELFRRMGRLHDVEEFLIQAVQVREKLAADLPLALPCPTG
jgi:hypothetical protein